MSHKVDALLKDELLEDNLLKQQAIAEQDIREMSQRETQINEVPPNVAPSLETEILSIGLLGVILIGILLLLKVIVLKVTSEHKQVVATLKHIDKVPCKNCQFFSNNSYLKCAVHPSIVSTEAAIDCSDYCPKLKPRALRE